MIPKKQNEISNLPTITNIRYENIFRVYQENVNGKAFYWYNITNKINLPTQIDSNTVSTIVVDRKISWTSLSYVLYGTIYLWYLLYMLNKTKSKFFVSAGETITYIQVQYISSIINAINE